MTIEKDKKTLIRILKLNANRIGNSMIMGVGADITEDIIEKFKHKKYRNWAQQIDFKIINIHLDLTNFIEVVEKIPPEKLF